MITDTNCRRCGKKLDRAGWWLDGSEYALCAECGIMASERTTRFLRELEGWIENGAGGGDMIIRDEEKGLLIINSKDAWIAEKAVCEALILPAVMLHLPAWPSRWARFWHWIFFGIRWKAIGRRAQK